jgi:hypothetical protein
MKTKINLVFLGNNFQEYSKNRIMKWKSDVFELISEHGTITLPEYTEGSAWNYLDSQIEKVLSKTTYKDILIAITNVPLEDNFYMRRLSGNRVVISIYQIGEILKFKGIPIENFLMKSLYEVCVLYYVYKDSKIPMSEIASVAHDETRGCLFDMTGIKQDIIVSSSSPILCDICYADYLKAHVPKEILDTIRKELKKIKLPTYQRISALIKKHPIVSIIITIVSSLIISVAGNYISKLLGI